MIKNQQETSSFDDALVLVDFMPTVDDIAADKRVREEEEISQMFREKIMEAQDPTPEQTERDNWDVR